MQFIKNHPLAIKAFFDSSLVLTFAVPKEELQSHIPDCLKLDTFQNNWAFIAIAMVQTKGLRPKGFPKFMGNDFFLIGYRIFVRYTNRAGKRLRGLYIIKSQTNKRKMEFLGNLFTHYNYTTTDITQKTMDNSKVIESVQSKFKITMDTTGGSVPLPENSPFRNWKEARKFAGPLPHTFVVNEKDKTILTILGVRQNWKPEPTRISAYTFDFLKTLSLKSIVLANAFEIKNVPYQWEKGKIELWK